MKKLDIRSVLIGVLCTTLVFVIIGAKNQNKNLGHITVNSIEVVNNDGEVAASLDVTKNGGSALNIYNKHEKRVVALQSNKYLDGVIGLFDRYGEIGWGKSGKQ